MATPTNYNSASTEQRGQQRTHLFSNSFHSPKSSFGRTEPASTRSKTTAIPVDSSKISRINDNLGLLCKSLNLSDEVDEQEDKKDGGNDLID